MRKFENYAASLDVLSRASEQDLDNEFVQSGIIDKFSLQFELGWKLLKHLLAYEGEAIAAAGSPREILKASSAYYDFMDEETWLAMLRDRNNAAHTYDGDAAAALVDRIILDYVPEYERLRSGLLGRYGSLLTEPNVSS